MGWYDAYEQADVAYHTAIERRDDCSWTDQRDAFRAGFVAATGEQKAPADRAAAMEAMRGLISDLWEEVNPRRHALILLDVDRTATPDELDELKRLQSLADRMLQIIAPLPIAEMEKLQAEIAERWQREAAEGVAQK